MRRPQDPSGGGTPWRGLGFLRELRQRAAFAQLPRAEWATFVAIAAFWDPDGTAWLAQATIAQFAGYMPRSVSHSIACLEGRGVLRRVAGDPDGGAGRSGFAAGPLTLRELRFLAREPVSAPAMVAADPLKKNTKTNTKISEGSPSPASRMELPAAQRKNLHLSKDGDDERALARAALGEWFRRRRPRAAPPPQFPPADEEHVARCVAAVEGDLETKLEALRDAIVGAFYLSDRPPTVRYIWGKREHFLAHVARGRSIRLRRENKRTPPPAEQPA